MKIKQILTVLLCVLMLGSMLTDVVFAAEGTEVNSASGISAAEGSEVNSTSEISAAEGSEVNLTSEISAAEGAEVNSASEISAVEGAEANPVSEISAAGVTETDPLSGVSADEEDSDSELAEPDAKTAEEQGSINTLDLEMSEEEKEITVVASSDPAVKLGAAKQGSDTQADGGPYNPAGGYTLSLNPNYNNSIIEMYTNVTTMSLPSYSRPGYELLGWAETATDEAAYRVGEPITLTSDKTLYAVWQDLPPTSLIGDIPASDGGYVYVGGIRWHVIGVRSDKWLLISADVLGGTKTWNDAKNYCGNVYRGFTELEQGAVLDTNKRDIAYGYYSAVDLGNAKLFLLSASEAMTYFSSDADRQPGWWWLRSLRAADWAAAIYGYGEGDIYGDGRLGYDLADDGDYFGARPAFQLNLASVLLTSAAAGGKSSADAGSGEFGVFYTASENGCKLTLLDSSRNSFEASAANTTVVPGGTLAVTYSGAGTGENEYVSAIICDNGGDILYYASLISAGSGTWDMTIPAELPEGSYNLKMFSEQQNGDDQTDYAGPMEELTVTVSGIPVMTYNVTVTVSVNNESMGTAFADPDSGTSGTEVTLTAVPNEGYLFKEWNVTSGDVTVTGDKFTIGTADVAVQAVFEAIPVKKGILTFDLAGGTLDGKTGMITVEANVGDTVKLPGAPTREGYTFQYWKGSVYEAGAEYKVEGDHTFTAVWEENKAKTNSVTIDANGGNGGAASSASGSYGVNTGDNIHIGFWFMLMAASLTGLVVIAVRGKKFRR